MSHAGASQPDPSVIGTIPKPPFAREPDPLDLFVRRVQRLRSVAPGHRLEAYLRFLADLAEVQYRIQDDLPAPAIPDAASLRRARQHEMPPLDRQVAHQDPALDATLDRLLAAASDLAMPDSARAALDRVTASDRETRAAMVQAVLADAIPVEAMAEHVFVAAALQVHFARAAAHLDGKALVAVGDGACPACGSPPTASLVVGWAGAEGTRYCACSLCGTLWNYVRAKCTTCGSTKQIGFQEVAADSPGESPAASPPEGEGGSNVKAETCGECHTFLKVLYQQKDPALDPVADDVASLALDILVRDLGFNRAGVNYFLLGY